MSCNADGGRNPILLNEPNTAEAAAHLENDRAASGYVMNFERAWA
jgi:hypothetical protein